MTGRIAGLSRAEERALHAGAGPHIREAFRQVLGSRVSRSALEGQLRRAGVPEALIADAVERATALNARYQKGELGLYAAPPAVNQAALATLRQMNSHDSLNPLEDGGIATLEADRAGRVDADAIARDAILSTRIGEPEEVEYRDPQTGRTYKGIR